MGVLVSIDSSWIWVLTPSLKVQPACHPIMGKGKVAGAEQMRYRTHPMLSEDVPGRIGELLEVS